ncbi:MAG: tRNA-binding protein [Candidatus Obscuribacterales bacterium]|nr:tRNA-binding protein [Candidatus Obscuribacterales bacterium]
MSAEISYDDFLKVDMRVGKIIAVDQFPEARKPAYKLTIDFGPLGIKQSSAQVTRRYDKDSLLGKLIVAVVNFPVKKIAGFKSEVLVLGSETEPDVVVLLKPENGSQLGSRVF